MTGAGGASLTRALRRRLGAPYSAGPDPQDAVRVCRAAAARGLASTASYWDGPGDDPGSVARAYVTLLDGLADAALDAYLSVKGPALAFDQALFAQVAADARERRLGVHLDVLGPETVEPAYSLLERADGGGLELGCTLPGRWRRSVDDAERALALGLRVRVVKGEWPEARAREVDPRTGFLDVVGRLAGRAVHVAVATHDVPLARAALDLLAAQRTPAELEVLHGVPLERPLALARERRVPVRVYVSCGHRYAPYRLRDAVRRPVVLAWAARDLVRG